MTSADASSPSVIISGANRGMGLEYARQYAAEGWTVFAGVRKPERAEALNAIAAEYDAVSVMPLDVSDQASVDAFAAAIGEQPIDVLLSNASHMIDLSRQSFEGADVDAFAYTFEVNAIGPFRLARAFIDNVRASEQKKMMFMGSTAGSTGSLQPPVMLFGYCPAKAALHSMVRGMHLNLSPEGITVGLLEPGVVDTQGFADVKPGERAPYGMDMVVKLLDEGVLSMATPAEAVTALRARIADMTPEQGGILTATDGSTISW